VTLALAEEGRVPAVRDRPTPRTSAVERTSAVFAVSASGPRCAGSHCPRFGQHPRHRRARASPCGMRSTTRTSAVGRRARCLLRAPAPTMRGDLSACRTVRIRCRERRATEAANRQAGEMPGSIVARSPVVAATAMASHVHGDSDHRQSACATVHRRPAGRAATAAAAFDIASGTSSAFRTMCLVRWCALRVVGTAPQSALPSRWRRATVRAAELAVAAGLVVVAGGGEPCRCVTASAGARFGSLRVACASGHARWS
jgi:hypothetical protein